MTMTEMKEQREKMKREAELLKQMEIEAERQRLEAQQKLLQDRGCGWGIGLLCYDIFKKKKKGYICDPSKREIIAGPLPT